MSDKVQFIDGDFELEVVVDSKRDTVWLTQRQMSELFEVTTDNISLHVRNIYKENELEENSTSEESSVVQLEGKRKVRRTLKVYNLDVIISVGFRIRSQRGIVFRKWANKMLKDILLKGYSYNEKVLSAHKQVINLIPLLDRDTDKMDSKQVLSVVKEYARALNLLDDYDHQRIHKLHGEKSHYILSYDELRKFIDQMKFKNDSKLFGVEKDESFKSSISSIYATFDGEDLYESIQEKAASLLYFVTKNHSFIDGNKRIAAAVFLYFLSKSNYFYVNNEKVISDETLVAITIMIASSKPSEKDIIIDLVVHLLST